uniref:Uncharacterized protein n=1 Tax=Aegilops tauschii subsp. strangulata TaxID=200361 RepID=A0A453JKZ9_AEGTS
MVDDLLVIRSLMHLLGSYIIYPEVCCVCIEPCMHVRMPIYVCPCITMFLSKVC